MTFMANTPANKTGASAAASEAHGNATGTEAPAPCPFCGSRSITVEWESCLPFEPGDTNRRWFAECGQCACQGPFCQKEPQVIPAWNKARAMSITWIPVTQELPDEEQTVLVYSPKSDSPVWIGFLDAGQWREVSAELYTEEVTHWAHLPEGPK